MYSLGQTLILKDYLTTCPIHRLQLLNLGRGQDHNTKVDSNIDLDSVVIVGIGVRGIKTHHVS
jgi:hypothetical protein